MTAPTALEALADRVEAATGADRELDCRISLMLSGVGFSDADVADMLRLRDEPTGYGRYCPADEYVPAYTASLDAATNVFPPSTMYRSGHDGEGPDPSRFFCQAVTAAPDCRIIRAVADTEQLARLAAALRARAKTPGETDVQ